MQPVNTFFELSPSIGTWGFSCLYIPLPGDNPVRRTIYYLRDGQGQIQHAEIVRVGEVAL